MKLIPKSFAAFCTSAKASSQLSALSLWLLALAACSSEAGQVQLPVEPTLKGCVATIPPFTYGDDETMGPPTATRTALVVDESGLTFQWAAGDQIGVVGTYYNEKEDKYWYQQTNYSMVSGAGTAEATFNGGAFHLVDNTDYLSYYPYDGTATCQDNAYRTLDFTGQTQTANASTAHLGAKDYMLASAQKPADGYIRFAFDHCCTPIRFTLTLPAAAAGKTPTTMSVTTVGNTRHFVTSVTHKMNGQSPIYTSQTYAYTLTLGFSGFDIPAGDAPQLQAWLMIFPVKLSEKTLFVTLTCTDGTVYTGSVAGQDYQAGKAYRRTFTLSDEIDMGGSVLWSVKNEGAASPFDIGSQHTNAEADAVSGAWHLPSQNDITAMKTCSLDAGSGLDSQGVERLGYYVINGANIIFLPFSENANTSYYWLSDKEDDYHKQLYFDTNAFKINIPTTSPTWTSKFRFVKDKSNN